MKVALITGISGQDGAYLAKLLLEEWYRVVGTSRDAELARFTNLERPGIRDGIKLESAALNDFRSVIQVLSKVRPDEIYNLAGQSSSRFLFSSRLSQESIHVATLNLLEAIRFTGKPIRLYNASSSECFGDLGNEAADEETPFRPRSPYATAKAAAFWQVANYREGYGIFACSGILFNHESPLRPIFNLSAFPDDRRFTPLKVPIRTLDEIAKTENIKGRGILKIDVQFSEHLVLEGAAQFLEQVDFVLIEVSLKRFTPEVKVLDEFVEIFKWLGFRYYDFAGDWRDSMTGELLQHDIIFARGTTDGPVAW